MATVVDRRLPLDAAHRQLRCLRTCLTCLSLFFSLVEQPFSLPLCASGASEWARLAVSLSKLVVFMLPVIAAIVSKQSDRLKGYLSLLESTLVRSHVAAIRSPTSPLYLELLHNCAHVVQCTTFQSITSAWCSNSSTCVYRSTDYYHSLVCSFLAQEIRFCCIVFHCWETVSLCRWH